MRNFSLSRTRDGAFLTPGRACALTALLLGQACAIYDDSLVNGAEPLSGGSDGGGTSSSSGKSNGTSGTPTSTGGSNAGTSSGKAGSAGHESGTAGDETGGSPSAGSGGSSSSGSGGTASQGGQQPVEGGISIDDMEDNDQQIVLDGGRNGYWYVGNDGTAAGTQDPKVNVFKMVALVADERPGSSFSAHMKVEGFTGWGSVIGFNFVENGGALSAYDASAYCGISFWAKAAAATTLRIRVPDADTHPAGKVCVDGGPAGMSCYDHFGASAAFPAAWKQFVFQFTDFTQIGTGYHPADNKLKTDKLFGLEWALPGSGKLFEIWIDDVKFVECK